MSARERDIASKATPTQTRTDPAERYRDHEAHPLAWADWPDDQPSYVTASGNPTTKWRNISINRIRERAQEASEASTALRVAQRTLQRAREEHVREVESLLGIKVNIGVAPCKESPTGTCLYPIYGERNADPWCLFCETPIDPEGD